MKTIANRLIVFAASTIAFGSMAFGQTRGTVEIPFAFHTVTGTLPAGTYEIGETHVGSYTHVVVLRNTASKKTWYAGTPIYNPYRKTQGASVEFTCTGSSCNLTAIRGTNSSLEYVSPRKSREDTAAISVPLKTKNAD
jgi:hypothetical protein